MRQACCSPPARGVPLTLKMASRTDLTLDIKNIARDSKHDEYSSEYRWDSTIYRIDGSRRR